MTIFKKWNDFSFIFFWWNCGLNSSPALPWQPSYHLSHVPSPSYNAFPGLETRLQSRVPMAHACNPSYSGGRDQEDRSSKPAWANSSRETLPQKKPITKKGFMV
jgi:hypothetical protein